MPQAQYATTVDLDDDNQDMDVTVEYDWGRSYPAVREGPMAGPAEGGEVEITKVYLDATKEDITNQLSEDQLDALTTEIQENASPEAEEEEDRADYLYDLRRDERLEDLDRDY